jgi:hypothetical protein
MRVAIRGSILAAVAISALALAPTVLGQSIPRLPDGKPDLSGVWDRPRITDITRSGNTCGSESVGCKQEGTGDLPYTPWGQQRWTGTKVDWTAYCLPWGYSRAWQTEYPVEIVHTAKRLAILFESNNIFHLVNMNGEHPKDLEPSWLGHSTGKWEGDTLVIDTIGFNGLTYMDTAEHPMSAQMHMVERIRYIDADHLSYEVTWTDPKTYTRPIKNTRVFVRMKPGSDRLLEYWCMENNKELLDGNLPKFPGYDEYLSNAK